ncbi:hypothetical protein ACFYKX_03995 [Cytobacillus sp. FJAT-54145]|uniref:DUF3953 domain-containing protein n=1 Tax=Cytobacillus spartinae TaxID=3299023 RepID=A0ABW6KAM9_9BACI
MTTASQPLWKKITAVALLVLGLIGLFKGRTELGLIAFKVIILIACLDWAMKYRASGKQSKFFLVMSIVLGILIFINLINTLF